MALSILGYLLLYTVLHFRNIFVTAIVTLPTVPGLGSKNTTLQPRVVHQFPNGTWVENLFVKRDGRILATLLSSPDLYIVNPYERPQENAALLHSFPDSVGLAGITEIRHNVYGVISGNWSDATFKTTSGSYAVWEVDMSDYDTSKTAATNGIKVRKITDMPQAGFLNSMIPLPTRKGTVLLSDAYNGVVWKLDTETGNYSIAIDEPEFKDAPNPIAVLAINGIKLDRGFLYFTTSTQEIFGRVRINEDGTKFHNATKVEILATGIFGDDLILDREGNAWIAADAVNTLFRVTPYGNKSIILGSPTGGRGVVAGITALRFGEKREDRNVLYMSSNGGIPSLINIGTIIGGRIMAVDVDRLELTN